jgi:hypothetical protein
MPPFPTPSSPSIQSVARLDCLSWDCPKIAPPSSLRHRSPLREDPCGIRLRDEPATTRPRSVLVVSTTSTACSFDATRVCCNALPTLGFTPFQHVDESHLPPTPPPRNAFPALRSLPSVRSYTSRRTSPHANVRRKLRVALEDVAGVSPRRSPPSLPPRPFLPLAVLVAAVARACAHCLVP